MGRRGREDNRFALKRTGPNLLIDDADILGHFLRADKEKTTNGEGDVNCPLPRDFADKKSLHVPTCSRTGSVLSRAGAGYCRLPRLSNGQCEYGLESLAREKMVKLAGEVIRTMKDTIKARLLDWSPRTLLAMCSCDIQASAEVSWPRVRGLNKDKGPVSNIFSKIRDTRANYFSQSYWRIATRRFTILHHYLSLPVVNSLGFTTELRKKSAGLASPQLKFCGFELLDQDSFEPRTEEELEYLGEFGDRSNVGKTLVDSVRSRKGLLVTGRDKVVGVEKGRTFKETEGGMGERESQ